ncbi:hypothetical protein BD408DRAFT_485070 [Parasitella parasitica]|nr:hypothetical protein BD408DRAFT_485070 [Parasitella parasitica]
MLSPSPSSYPAEVRKSIRINNGLQDTDADERSLDTPSVADGKTQLNNFDTTQLEGYVAQMATEAGINLDTTQLSNVHELEALHSILDQISKNINEGYSQRIKKESEKTDAANKELEILKDDAAWIEDTCNQITQKLQQLENEVKCEQAPQVDLPQLSENLASITTPIQLFPVRL